MTNRPHRGKPLPSVGGADDLEERGAESVRAFSKVMLEKLSANSHKANWWDISQGELIVGLLGEVHELVEALVKAKNPDDIAREAADVANYAMMLADVSGGLDHD